MQGRLRSKLDGPNRGLSEKRHDARRPQADGEDTQNLHEILGLTKGKPV